MSGSLMYTAHLLNTVKIKFCIVNVVIKFEKMHKEMNT